MKKRFIALLLCCVMLFTLSPSLIASAAADDDANGTTVETPAERKAEDSTVEEPKTEEPKTEEPKTEEPKIEEPKAEEPKTEEPKAEEPKAEEPKTEEPKAEEPKAEEPKAEDETTIPAAEQPGAPVESEIITPTVNFTNVAPFLPPVSGGVRMLRAPLAARAAANFAANDAANDTATDNGMKISKTATANKDGSYTITLEAYATGSKVISEVTEDVPTDIVLVLDQSGSMGNCIVCGKEMDGYKDYHDTYVATTSINTNNTYYIKSGNEYTIVQYCSGTHAYSRKCDGGAGWYTSEWSWNHTAANKITPKTSDNQEGTQFYEYKGEEACSSRLQALKTAVTSFANSVAEKAKGADGTFGTDDDVNHRVAVVGFASETNYTDSWGQTTNYHYGNTEVFIGSASYTYNAGEADNASNPKSAQSYYASAFQDMDTTDGYNNVIASKDALDANGGTFTNLGIEMANGILNANPVPEGKQRNRVIIVFTDGAPGWSGYDSNVAEDAINEATTAKNNGVTVYTVGIFSGADATSAGNQNGTDDQKANWFMQNVSSNNGTPQTPSYYLSAADADTLKNIFKQISDNIESGGSSTTLDENAVIKDIISPQFTLPAGATASNITLESYNYNGPSYNTANAWTKNATAMGAEATIEGSQVSVTGFDFAENWCGSKTNADGSTTYQGNKLVISFKVQPKAGFLGGNDVYTNASAGVYENSDATQPVLSFPQPQVNVPIDAVTVNAADKNVYLLGEVTAAQLKEGATVTVGEGTKAVSLDLSKANENYGLADWQTAYVNITVEIKDANGNAVTDLTGLTDDTTYTVSVTVAPKNEALGTSSGTPATAKTGANDPAKINVFKPELTFQDSEVYYGDGVPTEYSNLTATKWKHGTTEANISEMGPAPTLSLIYTPDSTKIADDIINTKQDIAVDVTVKIGTADVTGNTTFQHTNCTGKTCAVPTDKEFLLHVKTCQLTITKTGGANNEPYVFNVYRDGMKYSEVTVWGNGTETLVELPVGTYTIVEDTGWSWRFNPTIGDGVTLSKTGASGTITCTNSLSKPYWLNGFSTVVENIFGVARVEQ